MGGTLFLTAAILCKLQSMSKNTVITIWESLYAHITLWGDQGADCREKRKQGSKIQLLYTNVINTRASTH